MSLPDYPVKTKDQDKLNRASMAKHVARLVNDFRSKESFVVGIEGEWGSGKSSFLNFVVEEVDSTKAEVIFFNPWNFSSQDQLIEDFFDSLLAVVEKIEPRTGLKDKVKKYKRKLKNVDFNPSAYGVSLFNAKINLTSLSSLRRDLESELERLNKKVVIIIDDLDRLDTEETLSVFKLVKITANFPNCIFFLAYDRKRVIERIDDVTNKSGDDYLKKIIQTTFRLPTINRKQLSQMVFDHINTVIADLFGDVKFSEEDTKRWNSISYAGFADLFQNIRDLKRFSSSLKLNLSVIGKHEINIIDFVTLEAIRVFAPDLYDEIPKNRWIFSQNFYGLTYIHNTDKRPDAYREITERTLTGNNQKDKITSIIKELFPQIDFQANYGSSWEEQWTGEKRVCSDVKFEAYFQLSAPSDEISEEEFETLMEQLATLTPEGSVDIISKIKVDDKANSFFKKIHHRFNQDYTTHTNFFINVCESAFSAFGDDDLEQYNPLDFDSLTRQFYRLVWRISERISGENNKYIFVNKILSRNKYLYQKVDLIRVLKREKIGQEDHLRDISLVFERCISELLPQMLVVIEEDTLKVEPHASHILWAYKEWGKQTEINNYIKQLAEDEQNIFIILDWLKSRISSSNRGIYYQITTDNIATFVDVSILDSTFEKIEREKLTDKQKELYDLYRNKDKDIW